MNKTACFIGHRNVENSELLEIKIKETIEDLIENNGVVHFLFGSKSKFDSICYDIITKLQKKYSNIERIVYTCRHETAILKNENSELLNQLCKYKIDIKNYEQEREHKNKYTSGKTRYIARNQAMIEDSDFCIFYFDENYMPPRRKKGKNDLSDYQPQSGTAIAYKYALQKKKKIINIYNLTNI